MYTIPAPYAMTAAHLALLAYAVYRAPPGSDLRPWRAVFGLQRAGYAPAPSSTPVHAPNYVRCMVCGEVHPNLLSLHTPFIIGCTCTPTRKQVLEVGIACWELQDLWHMMLPEHWDEFERHAQAARRRPSTLQPTKEPTL